MTKTRFDIAFAIYTISQFTNKLAQKYVVVVKRISGYLRKHLSLRITYKKSNSFSLYR